MRVANQTVSRNYLKHLETNYSNVYKSQNKIDSTHQYEYGSENPINAAGELRVRKAIANLENYQYNLRTADSIYSAAESSVTAISEIIQTTYEKCIEAANGTSDEVHTHAPDQLDMIAMNVEAYADEIARLMNLVVADRRIFGGVNNDCKAFAIEDGRVIYNGVDVDTYNDSTLFPNSRESYADIGLGMMLNEEGRVDEQSALALTFNGMDVIGCGKKETSPYIDLDSINDGTTYTFQLNVGSKIEKTVTFTGTATKEDNIKAINDAIAAEFDGKDSIKIYEHGLIVNGLNSEAISITDRTAGTDKLGVENRGAAYSNNIIQSILDAAKIIRTGDGDEIAKYADHIYSLQTKVSLTLAKIGTQTKFIEFNQTRLTNNLTTLQERENDLYGTDFATESTNLKNYDAIYSATLQMSAMVVPQSIFDFMS